MIDNGFTAFREIIKSTHVLFCKMLIQRKDGVLFMYDIPSFFIHEYLKFISCYFPLIKRLLASIF